MNKAYRILSASLWLLTALFTTFSGQATGNLEASPFIRDNIATSNFEPGDKYFLFSNSRGTVTGTPEGGLSLHPLYSVKAGSLELEKSIIRGSIHYATYFSNDESPGHGRLTEQQSRKVSGQQSNVQGGFTLYSMDIKGTRVLPPSDGLGMHLVFDYAIRSARKDDTGTKLVIPGAGYRKGAGYRWPPDGGSDEYSYNAQGIAQYIAPARQPVDNRTVAQVIADNTINSLAAFHKRRLHGTDKITEHNPALNAAGNSAEIINGVTGGYITNFVELASDITGISDSIHSTFNSGINTSSLAWVSVHPEPLGKMQAIDDIRNQTLFWQHTAQGIGYLQADYPNLAEAGITAMNIAAVLPADRLVHAISETGVRGVVKDISAGGQYLDGFKLSSVPENVALYPKLKADLIQQNLDNIAKQDPRLSIAVKGGSSGKKYFSIGNGSRAESDRLGKIWVGDGAKQTSGGGWISADRTRGYRPPSPKNSPFATTETQANFEIYKLPTDIKKPIKPEKIGNGHLNILD